MRHARSPRRPLAGCLIIALLLVALDCAGVGAWLKTGTHALDIELGVAGVFIVPEHGPRRIIDPPAPVWTIGFNIGPLCEFHTRGRFRLGMAQADLWTCR